MERKYLQENYFHAIFEAAKSLTDKVRNVTGIQDDGSCLPMYNPIIMLKRNFDVPGSNIRKIWKFNYKGSKLFPVDDN